MLEPSKAAMKVESWVALKVDKKAARLDELLADLKGALLVDLMDCWMVETRAVHWAM